MAIGDNKRIEARKLIAEANKQLTRITDFQERASDADRKDAEQVLTTAAKAIKLIAPVFGKVVSVVLVAIAGIILLFPKKGKDDDV